MPGENATFFESEVRPHDRAIMLGVFDGLHLGHQALLREIFAAARTHPKLTPSVATFVPHPAAIIAPARTPKLLQPVAMRRAALVGMGLQATEVLSMRFNQALAAMRAEVFIEDILVGVLRAREVVIGENFRFGHRRGGNTSTLQRLGQQFGYNTRVVPPLRHPRLGIISSTAIRQAITEGRISDASLLWGQHVRIFPQAPPAALADSPWATARRDPAGVWPRAGQFNSQLAHHAFQVEFTEEQVRWRCDSPAQARAQERLATEQGLTII